jgi:hypothetical protein
MWRMTRGLLALTLVFGSVGCTPKLLGPTSSGYFFSLQASDRNVWLEPSNPILYAPYPTSSILTVRVQDAQGRPVDGVPVRFQVEPDWSRDAEIVPQQTTTQNGRAQATFQAFAMGMVHVQAYVDTMTQQVSITVHPPYSIRAPAGD